MNLPELDVTWDAVKAKSNISKHGVTFTQAAMVLPDPLAISVFDVGHSEIEDRWFTLGRAGDGKLLSVSHTYQPTGSASARVRIISAREATRREHEQYENEPR